MLRLHFVGDRSFSLCESHQYVTDTTRHNSTFLVYVMYRYLDSMGGIVEGDSLTLWCGVGVMSAASISVLCCLYAVCPALYMHDKDYRFNYLPDCVA